MWHTESIDTFDDHFRDSSNFFDSRKESWITSITLSYWGFRKGNKQAVKQYDMFNEGRDFAPFPPESIAITQLSKRHWWQRRKNKNQDTMKEIEEGSSSLIVSSDMLGNWLTCSVISPILSEIAMSTCVEQVKQTLSQFNHQPVSARSLAFLIFLGALCEGLSKEYESILAELSQAIKLGV